MVEGWGRRFRMTLGSIKGESYAGRGFTPVCTDTFLPWQDPQAIPSSGGHSVSSVDTPQPTQACWAVAPRVGQNSARGQPHGLGPGTWKGVGSLQAQEYCTPYCSSVGWPCSTQAGSLHPTQSGKGSAGAEGAKPSTSQCPWCPC